MIWLHWLLLAALIVGTVNLLADWLQPVTQDEVPDLARRPGNPTPDKGEIGRGHVRVVGRDPLFTERQETRVTN